MAVVVTTKEELGRLVKNKEPEIIVTGDLAKKLKDGYSIKKLSKGAVATLIGLIAVATAAAPFTGGLSFMAATPIAFATGTSVVAVIAIAFIGVSLIYAIYNEYEAEFEFENERIGVVKLKLKNSKNSKCL